MFYHCSHVLDANGDYYTVVVAINGWKPNNTFVYIGKEHVLVSTVGLIDDIYWNDSGIQSEYYIGDKACGFVGNLKFFEINQGAGYINSGTACNKNCVLMLYCMVYLILGAMNTPMLPSEFP